MNPLVDKILSASEKINKTSIRGSANYIVVGSDVADMIQDAYYTHRCGIRKDKIKRIYENR